VRVLRLLGHGLGPTGDLVVAADNPEAADAAWRALVAGPDVSLELVNVRAGGSLAAAARRGGGAVRITPSDTCPYVAVQGAFDHYFESRSKELHRILRRSDRALEQRGSRVRTEVIREPAAVEATLPAITRVFDVAEAHNPRQHLLAAPYADFTRSLLHDAASVDALRLFVGYVDEDVMGFAITFGDDHAIGMWLNRFDPAFADLSPGHLISREMVRHGFDHRLKEVDFMLGDFRYKRLWCTDSADTVTISGARHGVVATLGAATLAATGLVSRVARRR
jgi:CelD/BcsL family acetyltransferase involved in cellulose biosynthesis